jgi:hypothetical protein
MRTLLELAEAACQIIAPAALEVTQDEKDLLDWFVKGLPGYEGGCTHLHGILIVVVDNGSNAQ